MLASTVQFSSNDQSSTTYMDSGLSRDSFPQTPNSVPDIACPLTLCSTPKQY